MSGSGDLCLGNYACGIGGVATDEWKGDTSTPEVKLPHIRPIPPSNEIRKLKPDGLSHLEIRDQPANAPVVELAAADFQMAGEFLFGHQVEFGARRRWVRVHAPCFRVNLGSGRCSNIP